jgi:Arc/MetJ family transcription regulator
LEVEVWLQILGSNELLAAAVNISGLKTKRETINLALEEFIKRRKRKEAMKLVEKIDFCNNCSPKKARGKA